MKVLKIFGIVVGIHVFALILIFAIPGCSTSTKPAPQPADTMASANAPVITVPNMNAAPAATSDTSAPATAAATVPTGFNPDAPATYADSTGSTGSSGGGVHFTPTRPNSPAASALLTPAVSDVTPAASYSVKSGDSLWTIAKRNHLTVAELASANGLRSSSVLHDGQKLIIPGKASTPSTSSRLSSSSAASNSSLAATGKSSEAPAAVKSSGDDLKHIVKSGETLGMIAHKYGVKARDIAVRNSISDPQKLRAGTELIIPGWRGTSSGKATKSSTSHTEAEPAAKTPPPIIGASESTPTTSTTTESEQPQPATQNANVPVINIDENPVTPAPGK